MIGVNIWEASEVSERAFAMPLSSLCCPQGPYRFTHREHLIVTYRTDPAALELAVPEPLKMAVRLCDKN